MKTTNLRPRLASSALAISAIVLHLSPAAFGATFTWDGGGADANSATSANWDPDTAVVPNSDVIFNAAGNSGTTINWTSGNIFSMTFGAGASAYTMTNAAGFQFNQANTGTVVNNSSVTQTFGSDVRIFFAGAKVFAANTGDLSFGNLGFRADLMAVNTTNTLTLAGSGNGEITGIISQIGTGAGGVGFTQDANGISTAITKMGSGVWTLSGNNSFTGKVTTSAGILRATTNANALGSGSASLSLSGGTLQLANDTPLAFNRNTSVTANTTVTADRLTNAATSTTHTLGTLSLATTLTATRGTNITGAGIGGVTFGATSLSAAGTISSSPNTLVTLASVVNGGFLLTATGAGDTTVTGIMSGSGGLTKTSSGTLNLSGNNSYNGPTNVQGGTLTLSGNRTATSGDLTVAGGGPGTTPILNIQNGTFGTGQFVIGSGGSVSVVNHSAGTISSVGGSGILLGSGGTASTGTYNLSGGSLTAASIIMGVNNITVGTGVNVINQTGGSFTSTTLRIGRYDAVGSAGTDNTYAQSAGSASVTSIGLGGNTADSAGTNPISASLNLTGGTFTNTNFASLSAGGANISTINIGGTADVTLGAFPTGRGVGSTATISFDGGTLKPAAASTIYMGGLTNAFIKAGGARLDVATGRDIMITQALLTDVVSTGGGLTKEGVGGLTLTGNSTFTGATTLSAGTLEIGSTTGRLAGTSGVVLNGGTLLLSGSNADRVNNAAGFTTPATTGGGVIRLGGGPSFTETLGSLSQLNGTTVIDFGTLSGTNVLTFAASTFSAGSLQVWNWSGNLATGSGMDQLFFGNTGSGLTGAKAGSVEFFTGDASSLSLGFGTQLATGELVPVPEPTALSMAFAAVGAAVRHRRRSSQADVV